MDKVIVVKKSEIAQGVKGDYLKVTAEDDKTYNIFDQSLWNLFNDGLAVELMLEKQGRWLNVTGAKPAPKPSAEEAPAPARITRLEIAPQERGMWWKEVGENFRSGLFKKDEGSGALLWRAYVAQMLASLEIKLGKKEE